MSLKPDKHGNIPGYIKKEHHDKVTGNLNKKIIELNNTIDEKIDSFNQLENNHNIFLREYKKKCEEYNKVLIKLESKNVKKDVYEELNILKNKLKKYSEKYGDL